MRQVIALWRRQNVGAVCVCVSPLLIRRVFVGPVVSASVGEYIDCIRETPRGAHSIGRHTTEARTRCGQKNAIVSAQRHLQTVRTNANGLLINSRDA